MTGKMQGMQASEQVLGHVGGAWDASLNHYDSGGGCMVTTQQVDEWIYVIGQDDFRMARYSLPEWLGEAEQNDPSFIEADDPEQAWELFQLLRSNCYLWQCGACDAWIFTSNRPRIGVLRCSTCGQPGVDFRHADRHVGGSS